MLIDQQRGALHGPSISAAGPPVKGADLPMGQARYGSREGIRAGLRGGDVRGVEVEADADAGVLERRVDGLDHADDLEAELRRRARRRAAS